MIPEEIMESAKEINLDLFSEKSRALYEKDHNIFVSWCKRKGIHFFAEPVVLAYLGENAKKFKAISPLAEVLKKSQVSTLEEVCRVNRGKCKRFLPFCKNFQFEVKKIGFPVVKYYIQKF